jgi:hypothetical protein
MRQGDKLRFVRLACLLLCFSVGALAQEAPCGLTSVAESQSLIYPPIAKAAHVSGLVILLAEFRHDGSVSGTSILSGPEMLRSSARNFVVGWKVNPYGGSRTCPIVIRYQLDTSEPDGVYRMDLQHVTIRAQVPTFDDLPGVVGRRR